MTGIWNLSTLCRCCHADGHFKSLNVSYQGKNYVEIYENMIRDTFGVLISNPALEASYTICDECIFKLREATEFKNQVVQCEQKFQIYCYNEQFTASSDIKFEKESDHSDFDHDDVVQENDEHALDIKKEDKLEIENAAVIDKEELSETTNKTFNIKSPKLTKNKEESKNEVNPDFSFIIKVDTDTGTQFSCKNCGVLYKTQKELNEHLNKVHATLFKCEFCQKELKTIVTYKNHLKGHTRRHNQCSYCKKKFTTLQSFKDHINSHTKEKIYKCDICQKDFSYKQTLIKHLRIHAGTNKRFLCDLCGGSFNDKSNLNAHTKSVHEKLRPFQCKICKKFLSNQRHLRDHLKLHNGDRKLFKCDICDHRLSCQKGMQIHRLQHDGKYMCRFCSEIFVDAALKTEHIKIVHKAVKLHTCSICGKLLAGIYSLNRHMDDHKGIKRYSCDMCGLKFSQNSILKRHIFRKHKSQEEIDTQKTQCDICKRSYKNILAHKKIHNTRLCACSICGKTYPNNSALNRHKLEHFGKTFNCDVCDKKYLRKDKLKAHRLKVHQIKIEKGFEEGS